MLKNIKIGTKLVTVGALLIAIPLAVVAFLSVQRASLAVMSIESEQLARAARLIATSINNVFLEEQKVALNNATDNSIIETAVAVHGSAANAPKGKSAPSAADLIAVSTARIKATTGLGKDYESIMVVGTDGVAFASTDPAYVGGNFSDRAYIHEALAGKATAGTAVISKVTNKPVVPVAAPIKDGRNVVGAYVLVLDAQFLNDLVTGEKVGKTGYAYVVDNTGLVIAHPVAANLFKTNLAEMDGTKAFTKRMIAG
ncbi:MAG TPA: cache domain-containing protein, partial [Spirochaetia bacterium]|nr:cache domain-containing protein [Spirochaetia bacterium]